MADADEDGFAIEIVNPGCKWKCPCCDADMTSICDGVTYCEECGVLTSMFAPQIIPLAERNRAELEETKVTFNWIHRQEGHEFPEEDPKQIRLLLGKCGPTSVYVAAWRDGVVTLYAENTNDRWKLASNPRLSDVVALQVLYDRK